MAGPRVKGIVVGVMQRVHGIFRCSPPLSNLVLRDPPPRKAVEVMGVSGLAAACCILRCVGGAAPGEGRGGQYICSCAPLRVST